MPTQRYAFGPYEFDEHSGRLGRHGVRIKLQRKPQQILLALLETPGETVTRSELQSRLWPQDTFVDFETGLNVAIKKLRDALCDSADSPAYIVTEPGVGYRFIGTVKVLSPPMDAPGAQAVVAPKGSADSSENTQPFLVAAGKARPSWISLAAMSGCAVAAFVVLFMLMSLRRVRARPVQAVITLPQALRLITTGENAALALSPDGGTVVFSAIGGNGRSMLWLRRLDSLSPTPLPGTEAGGFPFWSPDGKKLGFFTDLELRQVDLSTGAVTRICVADSGRGGAWTRDGTLLFAPSTRGAIYKISASGGEPVPVTHPDEKRFSSHRWPSLLADGKHFVFLAANHETRPAAIFLGSIDGSSERLLAETDTNAIAVSGGLLFVSGGKLVLQKLKEFTWALEPHQTVLAEGVDYDPGLWLAGVAVSGDSLLYRRRSEGSSRQTIAWFDRRGNWLASAGRPGIYRGVALSPNGREVAVLCGDPDTNLCLLHSDGSVTQITNSPVVGAITWAPDSSSIAYYAHSSNQGSETAIKNLALAEPERRLPTAWPNTAPLSFHPDHRHILLAHLDPRDHYFVAVTAFDLGTRSEVDYLPRVPGLLNARFSPDGKWVAYASRESGTDQVYVTSFPSPTIKYQVSAKSGVAPRWRGDGRELYFLDGDDALVAVAVSGKKSGLLLGAPQVLFHPPIFPAPWDRNSYDVHPDGTKFVINAVSQTNDSDLVILTNWGRQD